MLITSFCPHAVGTTVSVHQDGKEHSVKSTLMTANSITVKITGHALTSLTGKLLQNQP